MVKKIDNININSPENETGAKKHKVPEIVQAGHPALHTPAKEVIFSEIKTPKIKKVIADMVLALESQEDGVGLAAPQIGESLRIFIVAGFIFDRIKRSEERALAASRKLKADENNLADDMDDGHENIISEETKLNEADNGNSDQAAKKINLKSPHQIFINPIIVKESKEKKWMDGEGCLSVRWLYGKVRRSTKVTLRAYNENGEIVERGASGILAHIFQHEVDHLDGILFIEKAKDIQEFDPEEIKEDARKAKIARDNKK